LRNLGVAVEGSLGMLGVLMIGIRTKLGWCMGLSIIGLCPLLLVLRSGVQGATVEGGLQDCDCSVPILSPLWQTQMMSHLQMGGVIESLDSRV